MVRMKSHLLGLLAVVAVLPGGPARADEASAARASARQLMREGNSLYAQAEPELAYRKYRAAWHLAHGFDVACNLGRSALDLGHTREAAEYLDYCLRHYSLSSREDVVHAEGEIRHALRRARSEVTALTIQVAPAGAEVLLDGSLIGHAPLADPVFVESGDHRIEARLAGHGPRSVKLAARPGTAVSVTVDLANEPAPRALPASQAAEPVASDRGTTPSAVPALVTGAVAAAGVISGGALLAASFSKDAERSRRLAALPGSDPCGGGSPHLFECTEIRRLSSDASTLAVLSVTSFGLAAASGVATYFLWPRGRDGTLKAGVRVLPVASRDAQGACALGVF